MNPRLSRRGLLAVAGALGTAGTGLLLWPQIRALTGRDPLERARLLGEANGILIAFGDPAGFFVPPHTAADARIPQVEMEPAPAAAFGPALDGVEQALSRYPAGFAARLVKAIFICGQMRISGARAGGTYGPAWLLLSTPADLGMAAVTLTCRMGVHHELSSFVYLRGATAELWRQTEPAGWAFAADSAAQLGRDGAPAPPPETGFLSAYGATSSENDFNVYAEMMMTQMESVARLARQFPLVASKAALVRAGYAAIDARMDSVFTQLGLPSG
jgi:hypothetical protein